MNEPESLHRGNGLRCGPYINLTRSLAHLRRKIPQAILPMFLPLIFCGCIQNFGRGGTGEIVVPPERLHNVSNLELTQTIATQPATTNRTTTESPAPEIMLSLQECRALALKNNLDLKVELFNPSISHTSITEEEAAFEAVFGDNSSFSRNTQPASKFGPANRSDNLVNDPYLQIPLRTGGSLRMDWTLERLVAGDARPGQNPTFLATPNVTFSQPLLRGFGTDVNAQGIRIAFYQFQQTEARTKLEVIRVLAENDHVYWQLYAARQLLDVRRKQYNLAAVQLERARRTARAGIIAEVDIVRAESGVADQLEQIINAENSVRQSTRDLKRILNKPGLEMDTPTVILPATKPNDVPFDLNRSHLTAAALNQRMEMLDVELQIAQESANIRFARNQTLPLVAFNYTFGLNATGQRFGQTYDQVWNKDFESHNFGLQVQIPIGNEAARSRLRRAMLARLQQLATREQRALQVRQDVLNAADTLETDWQRILANQKRVELASRTLDVETHQFEQGLRTSTDVLDAQSKLADAQSSEVAAIADYQIAQVDLAVATGTTLGASRVTWRPYIYGRREP